MNILFEKENHRLSDGEVKLHAGLFHNHIELLGAEEEIEKQGFLKGFSGEGVLGRELVAGGSGEVCSGDDTGCGKCSMLKKRCADVIYRIE